MKKKRLDSLNKVLRFLIAISLIIALGISIYMQSWMNTFVSSLALIFTFFPTWIEKRYGIDIPDEFETFVVLFIYASLYLGEVQGFYFKFWWWDILLHFFSAIALGFIGLSIWFILYKGKKIKTNPFLISLLAFSFAISIGAIWEIFEFTMDQLLGLNMQKSGLVDTMWDLIVDTAGAFITSAIGYIYLKKENPRFLKRFKNLFQ